MVCRGVNSICPIHAFLLSRSVQATGGGSCWALLPGLIFKGYKLHYPAQSEAARTAPSLHTVSPSPFLQMLLPVTTSISLSTLHPSHHFPLSWWLMAVVLGALSISIHRSTCYIGKGTQTHARSGTPKHTDTQKVRPGPGRSNKGNRTGLMGKQTTVYGSDSINLSLQPEPGSVFV